MDKGYDSEDIHSLARDKLGSIAMIPLRQRKRKKIKGKYRRKMRWKFDEELYHNRNLVETMFSVLKRKYGEEIRAKKYWNQLKEIKFKLLAHNLEVCQGYFYYSNEDFYRALFFILKYKNSRLRRLLTDNKCRPFCKSEYMSNTYVYR